MFKNKRVIVAISCILSATIIASIIIFTQNFTLGSKVNVVVATKNISAGQLIKEADVTVVEMTSKEVPTNVITDKSLIVGKYATIDFRTGDFALITKIASIPLNGNSLIASLNPEKIAIAIAVTSTSGFNDKLISGDIVKIFSSKDEMAESCPDLQYVRVLSVTKGNAAVQATATDDTSTESEYSAVVLEVSTAQAEQLLKMGASTFLTFVCHGSDERATALLNLQESINI